MCVCDNSLPLQNLTISFINQNRQSHLLPTSSTWNWTKSISIQSCSTLKKKKFKRANSSPGKLLNYNRKATVNSLPVATFPRQLWSANERETTGKLPSESKCNQFHSPTTADNDRSSAIRNLSVRWYQETKAILDHVPLELCWNSRLVFFVPQVSNSSFQTPPSNIIGVPTCIPTYVKSPRLSSNIGYSRSETNSFLNFRFQSLIRLFKSFYLFFSQLTVQKDIPFRSECFRSNSGTNRIWPTLYPVPGCSTIAIRFEFSSFCDVFFYLARNQDRNQNYFWPPKTWTQFRCDAADIHNFKI